MKKEAALFAAAALLWVLAGVLVRPELTAGTFHLTAAVAGIDIEAVKKWATLGGLKRDFFFGDNGTGVFLVQKALATDPDIYPQGTSNGNFGEATKAAITRFQQTYGLDATGVVDAATRAKINDLYLKELCPQPAQAFPDFTRVQLAALPEGLPHHYVPARLTDISGAVHTNGIICVTAETAQALGSMVAAAKQEGIMLGVTSGYRRPDIQALVHYFWVQVEGEEMAARDSALPHFSEHQLGTVVDMTGASIQYRSVDAELDTVREGQWLLSNAYKYGFALSYPKSGNGKFVYEPWHWRYLGIPLATSLHTDGRSYDETIPMPALIPPAATPVGAGDTTQAIFTAYIDGATQQTLLIKNADDRFPITNMTRLLTSATATPIVDESTGAQFKDMSPRELGALVGEVLQSSGGAAIAELIATSSDQRIIADVLGRAPDGRMSLVAIVRPQEGRRGAIIMVLIESADIQKDADAVLTAIDKDYRW